MDINENENNNNKIEVRLEEETTSGGNYIQFNEIHFRINKKNLFRVYSRNSWKKHGRWYGGLWQNIPKVLRKHIYVNDSTGPLVSLDFSAMHPRLAYHLKMIPYSGDPYVIDGYENGDAYSSAKEWRDYSKEVCLVSLNANSENSASYAI